LNTYYVDEDECAKIGEALTGYRFKIFRKAPEYASLEHLTTSISRRDLANALFFTVSIDQQLQNFSIASDSKKIRGADALWRMTRHILETEGFDFFSPENLTKRFATPESLASFLLQKIKELKGSKLYLLKQRATLVLRNAEKLTQNYDQDSTRIADGAKDAKEVCSRLRRDFLGFNGSGKITALLMRIFCFEPYQIWRLEGLEALDTPQDMRTRHFALKTGMVRSSERGKRVLIEGSRQERDLVDKIRVSFRVAATHVNVAPLYLDEPAWHIARMCCDVDNKRRDCGEGCRYASGGRCEKGDDCSFHELCSNAFVCPVKRICLNGQGLIDTRVFKRDEAWPEAGVEFRRA